MATVLPQKSYAHTTFFFYSVHNMCYKLLNGLVDLSPNEFFFHFASFRGRGHSSKLAGSLSQINTRKYHFTNRVIDIWNSLPASVVETASFDSVYTGLHLVDLRRFCV